MWGRIFKMFKKGIQTVQNAIIIPMDISHKILSEYRT